MGMAQEHRPMVKEQEKLDANRETFRRLVSAAVSKFSAGRHEAAALAAQQAASFAWFNHPGLFADTELESLLWNLGGTLQPGGRSAALASGPRVVLHVATQVYPTGGHTQMLGRWIREDPDSEHRIATVRQGSTSYPAKITSLLAGNPVALDRHAATLLGRAQVLREQAQAADYVVVHAHPDDVVPALALAGIQTPSIYVNHADHVFWAGSSVPHLVVHLRSSGARLSHERRFLPDARSFMMNRPLAVAETGYGRERERGLLGIESGQVLLVTAASANKYEPIGSLSLIELLERCVQQEPSLVVRAAGPADTGDWLLAAQRTGGRLQALGMLPNVQPLFAAADLYVDSFPFSSLTSLLEAGSHGIPVTSFRGHDPQCDVLGADTPVVDECIGYPQSPEAFIEQILNLVRKPQHRQEQGLQIRHAIERSHAASWQTELKTLYVHASLAFPQYPEPRPAAYGSGVLDEAVRALQERTGYALGEVGTLRAILGVQPLAPRLASWVRLAQAGLEPRTAELCRDRWRIRIELTAAFLRRSAKRAASGLRAVSKGSTRNQQRT